MKKLLLGFTLLTGVVFANDELKFNIKLHNNTQEQNGFMLCKFWYISDNISCPQKGSWMEVYYGDSVRKFQNVFTANVPLILEYRGFASVLKRPALSLHTRVGDTSLYFVVQKKISYGLENEQDNKVTVKYHPLISDGINKPNNKVLKGKFKLRNSKGNSLGDYRDMKVSIDEDSWCWGDPENDNVLREMISSHTSPDNSIVISELVISDDIQKEVFIDQINSGIKKIVTVHVLLNEEDFNNFIKDMDSNKITEDNLFLEKYVVNQDGIQAIRDSLELYRKEIIKLKEGKPVENGESRNIPKLQLETKLQEGMAITNFKSKLPTSQSKLAIQTLKDSYTFDFLGIEDGAQEKEVEKALSSNINKFLQELGPGFAFVGSQYHVEIGKEDFYIDLLFYHCKLHCFVVIQLKDKQFEPEHAGKMNFCLSAVDEFIKQPDDNPSIGLILCKTKDNAVVKYTLKDTTKPIGVSEYKLRK